MAKAMTPKLRQDIEALIYKVFDAADKSKANSSHYKEIFASFSDTQFMKFISMEFPYRFHADQFKVPAMYDITKGLDILGVPLLEKVNMPYVYKDKNGVAVNSQECLVGYTHLKKPKQFVTKKNSMSGSLDKRDMKTGMLTGSDKNGKTSDREMESLAVAGLDLAIEEFGAPRADAMKSKTIMYNTINTTGQVSMADVPIDNDDSLSKNLMNVYLLGSHLLSNMINTDYYLSYTLKNKQKGISRK